MGLKEYRWKRNLYGKCKNVAIIVGVLGTIYIIVSIGSIVEGFMELVPGMGQAGIGAGMILCAYIAYKAVCYLDRQIIRKRFRELWDKK